jgi:hypothetical protein
MWPQRFERKCLRASGQQDMAAQLVVERSADVMFKLSETAQ